MKNQSGAIKTNLELYRVVMGGSGGYRRQTGGSDDILLQTHRHFIIVYISKSVGIPWILVIKVLTSSEESDKYKQAHRFLQLLEFEECEVFAGLLRWDFLPFWCQKSSITSRVIRWGDIKLWHAIIIVNKFSSERQKVKTIAQALSDDGYKEETLPNEGRSTEELQLGQDDGPEENHIHFHWSFVTAGDGYWTARGKWKISTIVPVWSFNSSFISGDNFFSSYCS